MEYTNEQIEKAIEALPLEFQEAIADSYISNTIVDIGKKYSLLLDKVGKLQDDTMLAVLGLISGEKLAETLIKDIGVDDKQSQLIVHDINELIFGEIRKKIRKRLEEERSEEKEPEQEEKEGDLNRDELLRSIENPEPAYLKTKDNPNFVPLVIEKEKTPEINSKIGTIPIQKLSTSTTTEQKKVEITGNENFIPTVKKIDPYREPI